MIAAAAAAADAAAQGRLRPLSHAQWLARLPTYAPDIVVVDFWATWCTTCIERFPAMVEMAAHYRPRGVHFVSMCMEDRDDAGAVAGAERFLAHAPADIDHFLLDEPLLQGFADFGLQSIPAVYVYDRTGTLRARLTGDDPNHQYDTTDIQSAIDSLLAQ